MKIWRNISFLNVKAERSEREPGLIRRRESVTYLGVYSEKAAILLNEVINWKINTCIEKYVEAKKNGYVYPPRYFNDDDDFPIKGGGLFVKCNAEVAISTISEVCLKFKEVGDEYIKKYIRAAFGVDEMTKAIKEKIANELKKFWEAHSKEINNNGMLKIKSTNESGEENVFEYREADYLVLYEFLKGRNVNKLKSKYDQTKLDEMIGKRVEDQFVITAVETIQNEIAKIAETCEDEIYNMEAEFRENCNKFLDMMSKKNKENKKRIADKGMEKIKDLQNQISEMIKMGNINFATRKIKFE